MTSSNGKKFSEGDNTAGNQLFSRRWEFVKGVVALSDLPDDDRIEIAFAGRSNVGKSSLINALVKRKALARTSNTPGRTQEINYFIPESVELFLVDLPGYGFAKAPKDRIASWTALVNDYLRGRANLSRVFLLVDSRHGLKENDRKVMEMLDEAAVSYQVILTKADKLNPYELEAIVATTQVALKKHAAAFPVLILTSAAKGEGIDELRAAIAEILSQHRT